MPSDFKEQLRRIADYKLLCTKHLMNVRINDKSDGLVKVAITVERTSKNIGTSSVPVKAMVWIDELGFDQSVEITRCEIFNKRGTKIYRFDPAKIKRRKNFSVKVQSKAMLLHPNDDNVTVMTEYSVIRRRNDYFVEWFINPTRNPEINIIENPPDLDVEAGFGGDDRLKITHIRGRYELDGAYFAPAVMKIRWWPKKALEEWQAKTALSYNVQQPVTLTTADNAAD